MPLTCFGQLSLCSKSHLAGLGPDEGEPVLYTHPAYRNLLALVPWAVLLALLGLRANRARAAWLVMIPVAVLYVCASLTPRIEAELLPLFAQVLALLWLVAHLVARLRPLARIAVALATAGTSAVVFALCTTGLWLVQGSSVAIWQFTYIAANLLAMVSIISAGLLLRRLRMHLLFCIAYALLAYPLALCLMTGYAILIGLFTWVPLSELLRWDIIGMRGTSVWLSACAVSLPFVAIAAFSRFYRQRLHALLGIMPARPTQEPDHKAVREQEAIEEPSTKD